jgi:hypothetical protein
MVLISEATELFSARFGILSLHETAESRFSGRFLSEHPETDCGASRVRRTERIHVLKYVQLPAPIMSVSRVGPKSKRKKGAAEEPRRSAVKDAMPDTQPVGRIRRIRKVPEIVAENDEEDD